MTREEHRRKAMAERRRAQQRKMRNRRIVLTALLVVLVAALSIGGTVAWLTATSGSVVNTFTVGDINIDLTETKGTINNGTGEHTFKIIPGADIEKDPKVTVKAGSEACWLFVKVEETNWPDITETVDGVDTRKVKYTIANGWTKLDSVPGVDNVYYRTVTATTADTTFSVLADDKVYVSANLTKTDANTITNIPKLTFTAYAVQQDGVATAADAWGKVSN